MPSCIRAVNSRLTDLSMSASVISPCLTALGRALYSAAAVKITASFDGGSVGFFLTFGVMVIDIDIADRAAVGYDIPVKSPFLPQVFLQEKCAGIVRNARQAAVRAHDRLDLGLAHSRFKRRQIRVIEVIGGDDSIENMPLGFRPAMHGEVLGCGDDF